MSVERNYEDIKIGEEAVITKSISEEDMLLFEKLSGDKNPLHTIEDYAKEEGFKGKVVYGMLIASFISALAGMHIPGERSLLLEVKTRFLKAVTVGDKISVKGVVTEKRDFARMLTVSVEIRKDNGEKVGDGYYKVKVR